MKIGNFTLVRAAYGKRFYWLPRRLTPSRPPYTYAIYRWGYWNYGFNE